MNRLMQNMAVLGTGAVVLWGVVQIVRDELHHAKRTRKQQMQTWEGEGGNLAPHEQSEVMPPAA
ncbi:MAG TPA: hypothetical protein VMV45_17715 [Casimicrobiaceae bacterium]|nr:hypothetical protein [Casimicrobiaceae bacterium]